MSSRRPFPGRRLQPLLWAVPGLLIALVAWPTQTGSAARFWIGVLVGMSVVALGAGIVAYVRDRDAGRTEPVTHPNRR